MNNIVFFKLIVFSFICNKKYSLSFLRNSIIISIKFEAVQDKCDLLNNFNVGDLVDVDFNLKGRKWTNPQGEVKYFNSLQAWRIMPHQQSGQDQGPPEGFSEVPPPGFDQNLQEDVPF